jgi:hypothetical protein
MGHIGLLIGMQCLVPQKKSVALHRRELEWLLKTFPMLLKRKPDEELRRLWVECFGHSEM